MDQNQSEKIVKAAELMDAQDVPEEEHRMALPFIGTENTCVREFHQAMEQPMDVVPCKEEKDLFSLRMMLIQEEYKETMQALMNLWQTIERGNNIPSYKEAKAHVLKELMDLKYVIEGFCVTYGMDSVEAFDRVHASNMSKLVADEETGEPKIFRTPEGKVQKGPNYEPPNLMDLTNDKAEKYFDTTKR